MGYRKTACAWENHCAQEGRDECMEVNGHGVPTCTARTIVQVLNKISHKSQVILGLVLPV